MSTGGGVSLTLGLLHRLSDALVEAIPYLHSFPYDLASLSKSVTRNQIGQYMSDTIDQSLEGIEQVPLSQFTEQAYLNYSMYVILDRA
ncbi:MAG: hypothetical protein DBP01_08180, partial [gamma proteobacterium symbiont of Ctena orbiculata]